MYMYFYERTITVTMSTRTTRTKNNDESKRTKQRTNEQTHIPEVNDVIVISSCPLSTTSSIPPQSPSPHFKNKDAFCSHLANEPLLSSGTGQ